MATQQSGRQHVPPYCPVYNKERDSLVSGAHVRRRVVGVLLRTLHGGERGEDVVGSAGWWWRWVGEVGGDGAVDGCGAEDVDQHAL